MEENIQGQNSGEFATKLNSVNKALCRVAGADLTILIKYPSEISRIARMGAIIISTAILASFSMFYAIETITQSTIAGIIVGVIWGAAIFILDSYIIASYKKMENKRKELPIVLPRLVLALILGFSISIPMELKIFQNEIEQEVKLIRQEKESENQTLANDIYKNQIKPVNEQKAILESSLSTILKPIQALEILIQRLNDSLINEKAGKGPSGKEGDGPIVKQMIQNIAYYSSRKNQLFQNDSIAINKYKKSIAEQDSIIAATPKPNPEKIGSLYGIAVKLDGLKRLKKKNDDVAFAYWILVFLILGIETAPIFVKFFTPKGKYDSIIIMDEYLVDLEQKKRQSDRHQEINAEIESYNDVNQIRKERQNKVNGRVMDEIASAQGEIAAKAIEVWKEKQLNEVDINLEAFITTSG
jgi:Domain of unknown function (DUF4407)